VCVLFLEDAYYGSFAYQSSFSGAKKSRRDSSKLALNFNYNEKNGILINGNSYLCKLVIVLTYVRVFVLLILSRGSHATRIPLNHLD
jgi:hypothetical protein